MKPSKLVFAILLCVSPAFADEPKALGESLTGEARALYEIGKSSFDGGDVPGALGRFTRAHELSSDPRLLWNMAACEAGLKHYARAMTLVDRYLGESGALLTDKDRQQATRFRAAAKPLVATVTLSVSKEVKITVDGETVPTSSILYLDQGKRRVTFTRGGYRGIVRTETVTGGSDLSWKVDLERLRINAPPGTRP
jgi:hypothetical protein